MTPESKIVEMEKIIKDYLPYTDILNLIHDRTHQELLRQLFSKLDESLHNESPKLLHGIMRICLGKEHNADAVVKMRLVDAESEG